MRDLCKLYKIVENMLKIFYLTFFSKYGIIVIESLRESKKKFEKLEKNFLKTLDKLLKIWYNIITEKREKLLKTRKVLKDMRTYDIREMKTATAIKRKATADLINDLLEMFSEKFGEDYVRQVGNKQIGFIYGTVIDKDGCEHDLIYTDNPIVKDWDEVKNAKSEIKPIYDLYEQAELYQIEARQKQEEKERKREQKQKQIEKDKARRKAERERKKAEKEKAKETD